MSPRINLSAISLRQRYALCVFLMFLGTAIVGRKVFVEPTREWREGLCLLLARLVQIDESSGKMRGIELLRKADTSLANIGIEAWVLDESGTPLSSSHNRPMPIDWSPSLAPLNEHEVVWASTRPKYTFAVIRLVTQPTRYVGFFFDRKGTLWSAIARFFLTYTLLWIATCIALVQIAQRSPRLALETPKNPESGMSLQGAVLSLVIVAIVMSALWTTLSFSFRGSSHSDLRMAVRSLSESVHSSVDCQKTFAAVDITKDCDPDNPKPIALRDSANKIITSPLKAAPSSKWNPKADGFEGSGRYGTWSLRAYCDAATKALVIRFAREFESGKFYTDPLTKRPYDWNDSAMNPLYGTTDRFLCSTDSKGGGESTKPLGFIGARTMYRYLLTFADLVIPSIPPNARVVKITANMVNQRAYGSDSDITEDWAAFTIIANLSSETSTGTYQVVGGSSPANVVLFKWQDESFSGVSKIEGWFTPTSPEVLLASTFRPRLKWEPSKYQLTLDAMPKYAPASMAFLIEFYGE